MSLCALCHRKLHHGLIQDNEDVLACLFKNHIEALMKSAIEIAFDHLIDMYK